MAYRANTGALYYAKKYDALESGWNSSVLVAGGGQLPSLDRDYLNNIWVATYNPGGVVSPTSITCYWRSPGSTVWNSIPVYDAGPKTDLGPPAIASARYDAQEKDSTAAYIVFPVYSNNKPASSYIVMAKVTRNEVVDIDTLDQSTELQDSFPSISVQPGDFLHVTWQHEGIIVYRTSDDTVKPAVHDRIRWSDGYNLTSVGNACHPAIAADDDTVLVCWAEKDTDRIQVRGHATGTAYDNWGASFLVSAAYDTACDWPTVALGDSIVIAYQKRLSADNYDIYGIIAFNTGNPVNLSNSNEPSRYGHVVYELHDDTEPTVHTIWTEELSANYAEVGYRRYELGSGEGGGGGGQSANRIDPGIRPMLYAPKPNPFTGMTNIQYATNTPGRVRISIFDIAGREKRTIVNTDHNPGNYHAHWNGKDNQERLLPAGIYFLRMTTPNHQQNRKVILTR